ncbi:TPA: CGNR zinc finger domain-containing protein, partial [Bacillus thuringiensis]|nr:CGNR zinc finger domain-containing protein [Bacillus thuringiensis]
PDCVLLFIDKSGKRKWCSMKICGNRKKVAKFQDRKFEEV